MTREIVAYYQYQLYENVSLLVLTTQRAQCQEDDDYSYQYCWFRFQHGTTSALCYGQTFAVYIQSWISTSVHKPANRKEEGCSTCNGRMIKTDHSTHQLSEYGDGNPMWPSSWVEFKQQLLMGWLRMLEPFAMQLQVKSFIEYTNAGHHSI